MSTRENIRLIARTPFTCSKFTYCTFIKTNNKNADQAARRGPNDLGSGAVFENCEHVLLNPACSATGTSCTIETLRVSSSERE